MNVSPSLLSRQPSLSCCASWAQAELALYQSMLLILQRFVKNRTFDIARQNKITCVLWNFLYKS